MQPKTIKLTETPLGKYAAAQWNGKNESNFTPINDYILVLPDEPPETINGLAYTQETRSRVRLAAESGVLIAASDGAFIWNSDRTRPWQGPKPKPGDRIYFERYAGREIHGEDGRVYRCFEDKSVCGFFGNNEKPKRTRKARSKPDLVTVN